MANVLKSLKGVKPNTIVKKIDFKDWIDAVAIAEGLLKYKVGASLFKNNEQFIRLYNEVKKDYPEYFD